MEGANWLEVPLEVWGYLFAYLRVFDLAKLAQVNKFFYFVSSDENLWRERLQNALKRDPRFTDHITILDKLKEEYDKFAKDHKTFQIQRLTFSNLVEWMHSEVVEPKKFFWKRKFVQILISRKGVSWKPERLHNSKEALKTVFATKKDLRLVVYGTSGSGKSCTLKQIKFNKFPEKSEPTVEDVVKTQYTIQEIDTTVNLDILDTGSDEWTALRDHYTEIADGFVVMYSITDQSSFEDLSAFLDAIQAIKGDKDKLPPIVLVGNKCDLESDREVPTEDAVELATELGCPFFEASAKLRINCDQVLQELMEEIALHKLQQVSNSRVTGWKKESCLVM